MGSIPIICSMRDKLAQFPDLRMIPENTVWSKILDDDFDQESEPLQTSLDDGPFLEFPKPRSSPGDLSNIPTRVLLNELKLARVRGGVYMGAYCASFEYLKAELAKRPHVPNKKEGEALRRAASRGQTTLPSKNSRSRRKSRV